MGMAIMDTYFEKLDPKQTKNEESDDDDEDEDKNATETNDKFIYETKDPYVLRSLPYLIGSQAFLDNDHVGLKDLDSEEEDSEEEEDEVIEAEEPESDTESKHSNGESQLFSASNDKSRKISDSDTSSSSDDDDLFKPKAIIKNKGLFDDDDDSSQEDDDNQQEEKQPDMFDKDQEEPTSPKVVAPPVIDFASELSARLANKQNNIVTSTATKQPSPKPAAKQPMQTSNLFDSEEEDQDDNQIFKNNKTVPKSLFDDEDEEEITPVKKVVIEPEIITTSKTVMPKSDITSALNDLFAKKAKTKSFLSDEDDKEDPLFSNKPEIKPLPIVTAPATKKNISIFDDDEDDDFEIKKKPEPIPKQAPTKSLFDDDDEEEEDALFVTPSKPSTTQQAPVIAKKATLFDSSTDSSPESNLEQAKPKRKSSDSANKPKTNLFESSDESSPDLFSSTKIAPKQEATEKLFAKETNDSIPELQAKPAETVVDKQNEKLKTKKSLFDSPTEDEGDDIFKISTTRPSQPKPTIITEVKKASLFDSKSDDEDDDLFKTKKEPVFIEPLSAAKEPVFKEPAIPVRKPTTEDLASKLAEEKLLQSATPSKPMGSGKNMLFNPAALKNSNLFKKLAVQTKSSDESGDSDTEVKPAVKETPVLETPIKPPAMLENIDNFFTTSVPVLPNTPVVQPVLSNQNEDLFSDIKVDRAFGDNTLKNAQKDRIKATAGKKRSPANRRPIETIDDPFSAPIQSEPIKEAVKPVKELTIQQKPNLFDSSDSSPDKKKQEISEVNIRNNSMLLNFEQKITSRKSLENIFDDDDDDLFTTTKPTVKQTFEPAKPKQSDELKLETEKKKETVSVFDNSLDDFDLFSAATSATTKKKKTEKKVLDNIFDDDTDIFSDVANISSKKQVEEKKKTLPTKPETKKKS